MFAVAAAHAPSVAKNPSLKASELQREVEHVSLELAKPFLRNGETREIQKEVEFMVNRVKSLHDSELTSEFTKEIGGIEEALSKETSDHGLATEITAVRASLCAQNGFQNHEFSECEAFMRKSCAPADTVDTTYMNDAPLEDFCVLFFRQEASTGVGQVATAPAPGPAAGPGGAPGPAAPMGPFFGGKRLRALPDQGVEGPLVQHADFDTMVEDWQNEFGPKSGHRKFDEICADFPDNQWCRIHGYLPRQPRKTKVVTETVYVNAEQSEPKSRPPEPVKGQDPVTPERSGTGRCQLTLTALFAAVAMFGKSVSC